MEVGGRMGSGVPKSTWGGGLWGGEEGLLMTPDPLEIEKTT